MVDLGGARQVVESEDDLIVRAQAGDAEAFRALWQSLHPQLMGYLRVLAGGEAEDLAAETWLFVIRGLDQFDGDVDGFAGWVFTTARRRHLDWRRRSSRRPVTPVPDQELQQVEAAEDPASSVLTDLATEDALGLIAELAPDQAEVVALRTIGGLDVREVADVVGKRPGTVRVLAHRGLRRLAQRLGAGTTAEAEGVTQ